MIKKTAVLLGKIGFVSVCFVAVMGISGYFAIRLSVKGTRVIVPDVTGMSLVEAEQRLVAEDLILDVAAEKYDDQVEAGRILAQQPGADAPIKKFRKIKVVTSLGPQVFKIPELGGNLLRSALVKLEGEGLTPGRIVHAHTALARADEIVSQDPPPAGESLGHGGVSLLVSLGPREAVYVMPDVVGLDVREVARAFRKHGLALGGVRREEHAWLPSGAIARQYPEAGYPVAVGDPISLVVSR
jgi:beta-lactam-binding protein with PASTA domain